MPETIFLRLLQDEDKGAALASAIDALREGDVPAQTYAVDPASFARVPGSPFAYWVGDKIRNIFTGFEKTESHGRVVRVSNETGDDFRFIRLWNEVSPSLMGQKRIWVPHAKGGAFSSYHYDLHLLIAWDESRRTLLGYYGRPARPDEQMASTEFFFRPGLTYPRRTQKGFSVRILPAGCIFGNKGPAILTNDNSVAELRFFVGLMNSVIFRSLLALQMAFGSYEVGVIQRTPVPDLSGPEAERLGELALDCVNLKRDLDRANETSHVFHLPALLQVPGATLAERLEHWRARVADTDRQLADNQREIDEIAFQLYGIAGADRQAIEESLSARPSAAVAGAEDSDDESEDDEAEITTLDARALAADLVSYAVGAAFGRWDVGYATGERPAPDLWDPFAPLPVCSPGMLTGVDGLPLSAAPAGYPLTRDGDGILVNDQDHPDDLARRVREVLHLILAEHADAIEHEACGLLGVEHLRDYLRKPTKGGFWIDHVGRYSKSRRKAPIYWLLQSPKKLYGIWLSYHRLDKDMLFKVLVNYVEPKIRLERGRLVELQAEKQAASGREVRPLEKLIDRQETLVNDLEAFRERLERAAKQYLVPDHNDGVVLTIAPLWELVPWPVAKTYWNDLLGGKYAWSSIGKQLHEKGMVKR